MKPVTLRNITLDDLPVFYEHQRDAEAAAMAEFESRDWDAFAAHWRKILTDDSTFKQTILWDGNVVGNIVCYINAGKAEVGYWIGREYWGLGIATQALAQFLKLVFRRPLYAHVARRNIASRRVLEKCGFTLVGEDSWIPEKGGEPVEEYLLVLEK